MDLYLQKALFYLKIDIKKTHSIQKIQKNEEFILCYDLNPGQASSIEPVQELFLGDLVFLGTNNEEEQKESEQVNLPQGQYIFVQQRSEKALTQVEWLNLAIELQKDGLWERKKLENKLYIRFFIEDGKTVTQVFRPVIL